MTLLLDTHIFWRWKMEEGRLSREQARALERIDATNPALVSEISLLEFAMLFSLGRIRSKLPLREWLEKAVAPPLVERVAISPAIAAETAMLPNWFQRDPADRILVATARIHGATLVTSDARIIDAALVATLD
ncbi:MAG: type II toxin-antitoxin system VapC family toxin [Deltaproteobacteria bacterium]|nr:type II toxin-antitoxin system VapC family toxin [Deltaproteobacteria bacterium]